jgi:hypothetical protein
MTRLAAEAKVVPDMGDGVMSVGEYYKDEANLLSNSIYKIYRSNSTRGARLVPRNSSRGNAARDGAQDTIARPTGGP